MFISMNWISEYVDLSGVDKNELISRFSLSTAEVENEIFYKGSDISNVVAGKICSVEAHPDSKKLHLLKVDVGESEMLDIVCGAPNVYEGMVTAVAKVGGEVCGLKIEPRKVGGYMSYGMCCSEAELGLSDNHDGVFDIKDPVTIGEDIKKIYQIDDIIFEVDNKSLTNRPDLWGHYGIAREFAVLAKKPLRPLDKVDLSQFENLPKLDVEIQDAICQRYSCIKLSDIKENVSPVNMRIRLFYCGMRAINLLADLTNYLMLELGQPMHAFDSRKIEKVRIKRFPEEFDFVTLDGVERKIDPETLMICNGDKPVAIAGIMGGLDSEIVEDTTELTLESAMFEAAAIRKASVRLAHRTDASARYEKSLDPEMCDVAIARFLYLLQEISPSAKVISALTDSYKYHYPQVDISFHKDYVDKYTGIDISNETILETLKALGFDVTMNDEEVFDVKVPSWRATKDVTIKADIIEEITRIYGYDNFGVFTVKAPLYPIRISEVKNTEEMIKDILVKKYCLHELHSYVWAYYDECRQLGIEIEDNIKLLNAASPNIETIRRSIIPTQLCQVKSNVGYDSEFGIFEIGRVVLGLKEDGLCNEQKKLAVTLYSKTKTIEEMYYQAMDMIKDMVRQIKHTETSFEVKEAAHSYQHPKNLFSVVCGGNVVGEIGTVHPTVMDKIDKKANIVYMELDVNDLANVPNLGIHYEEPSKYPSIEVDLSFIADNFSKIKEVIDSEESPLLKAVQVIDVYQDAKEKSITTRLEFNDKERTLTREEVMVIIDRIIERLKEKNISLKA